MDGQLHTSITLKPVRFAFLIPAGDRRSILTAMETSTLLWGGIWNPIIPIYSQLPKWTVRPYSPRLTRTQWLDGHLDFFEPDVVVLAEGTKAPRGYGREDVIGLTELHETATKGEPRYGLSIRHIWGHLFRTRYRFVEHDDQPSFVFPADSGAAELHSSVVFGRLPSEHPRHLDALNFRELFRASPGTIDPKGLDVRLRQGSASPLSVTAANVPRWFGGEPAVFLYDHRKSSDLLAFWNLRACTNLIAAIPIAWLPQLQDVVRTVVESLHREPDERGMGGHWPSVVTAPGVPYEQANNAIDHLQAKIGDSQIWFHEYPDLWDYRSTYLRYSGTLHREAKSQFETVQVDGEGNARVPALKPDFIDDDELTWSESWTNHIECSSRWGGDDSSIVFPRDAEDVGALVSRTRIDSVRRVRGGIAFQCKNYDKEIDLLVPTGTELVTWWLQQRGWTATPSGSGRLAAPLLDLANGPRGVPRFCNKPILRAITMLQSPEGNGLASKSELLEWLESDDYFDRAFGNQAEKLLQRLLAKGIVRVGLRLQCSVCGQRGWHPLDALGNKVNCPSCLASFPFPADNPPERAWRYRAHGPYALPDHAKGSFSVVLAVAFFFRLRSFNCAYTLGLDLQRTGATAGDIEPFEVDAILFLQRQGWRTDISIVFCECKTNRSFEKRDFDRARKLADEFPEAILAFITLRDHLTNNEKRRFIRLLKRLPDIETPEHQVHRGLLILTPIELHHRLSLSQTWEHASGRAASFGKTTIGRNWFGDLLELCTITQHLYLSDEPAEMHHSASVGRLIGRPGYSAQDSGQTKTQSTRKKAVRNTRRREKPAR